MNEFGCEMAKPRLQRFADGELSREEAAAVRAHLFDCLSCRSIAGEVYTLRKHFEERDRTPIPPSDFARRVAAIAFAGPSVDREETSLLPFIKILTALAASVLLVAGALLLRPAGSSAWGQGGGMTVEAGVPGPTVDQKIERLRREREKENKPRKP